MSARPSSCESWRGLLLIAAGLIGLGLCVCLALGFTAFDLLPATLDRYLNLKIGQANLYCVTYADGSQGLLSENVVQPDSDAIPYARLYGDGGFRIIGLPLAFWVLMVGSTTMLGESPPSPQA